MAPRKNAMPCWTERGAGILSWTSLGEAAECLDLCLSTLNSSKLKARKRGTSTFMVGGVRFHLLKPEGLPVEEGPTFLTNVVKAAAPAPRGPETDLTPSGKRTLLKSGYCAHGVGKYHY